MSLCECMCVEVQVQLCVSVYMHIYMCIHVEGRAWPWVSFLGMCHPCVFSDRVSHCLENSVHRLTWLTKETRESTYSHLCSAGITSVCHQAKGFLFVCFYFSLMCILGIKLRYSFYLCMYLFICMHVWIWHLYTCVQLLKPEHTHSPEEDVRCPALSELSWWPASLSNPPVSASHTVLGLQAFETSPNLVYRCWGFELRASWLVSKLS